ncbi:MAG: hypothetical protein DWQ07_16395 [Chloroflexi bacterium]|nr:MAG: hypothetical protein DWQ07_16395 [Chloroflexota bacterium]MBL1195333.1 hypothetical protein [Chloroflexota bacterium]NOH12617.1 hypothetical protein [Chloroflexota bacterium]
MAPNKHVSLQLYVKENLAASKRTIVDKLTRLFWKISREGPAIRLIFTGAILSMVSTVLFKSIAWFLIGFFLLLWGAFAVVNSSLPLRPVVKKDYCLYCGSLNLNKLREVIHCRSCNYIYRIDNQGWVKIIEVPATDPLTSSSGKIPPEKLSSFRLVHGDKAILKSFLMALYIYVLFGSPFLLFWMHKGLEWMLKYLLG